MDRISYFLHILSCMLRVYNKQRFLNLSWSIVECFIFCAYDLYVAR